MDEAGSERAGIVEMSEGGAAAALFLIGSGAPQEPAVDELFARYERNAATPAAAQAVLRRSTDADCRPIMPAIAVPTLVVAHVGDPVIPIDLARQTASAIRRAESFGLIPR